MPRILLLIPTATYRAEAFVRAAQRLDADLTLASERPNSLEKFHPIELITLDFANPNACATKMATFAAANPIHAVIGVDDQVTVVSAAIGSALGLPHNPVDAAYATRNKLALRKRLATARVSQPDFRIVDLDETVTHIATEIDYPCVLKPLMMAASRGVIRCDDAGSFVDATERIRGIVAAPGAPKDDASRRFALAESYVPGWEVALEGIITNGVLTTLALFDKPDPLEGPYFPETLYVTPSRLPEDRQQRVIAHTQDAVRALGLRHGPIHAELRGDTDNLWLIELASRSIGGYCSRVLQFEGGLSLEDVITRHALSPSDAIPKVRVEPVGVLMLQAPRAGRFVKANGVDVARQLPNVTEIIVSAHPGQHLTPLPEGFLYVGFVFARAASVSQVEVALRSAHDTIDFYIDPASAAAAPGRSDVT